jgi:ABC-type multidrug transport system ATPase subunit
MSERLEIEGLGAQVGGRVLLDAVSFAVARGETLAVVGPNGAGKTTLLDCVAGLRPHAGTVRYAGTQWRSVAQRAPFIAYMPDELRLPEEIDVRRALLLDTRSTWIDALHARTLILRAGHQLSRGEQKRVQLCTALSLARPVLILDEPFAALDPRQLRDLLPVFRAATRNAATLVTVHQMRTAELVADRLILLSEGRIVALGTAIELRERTGLSEAPFEDVFLALLDGGSS